MVLKFDFTNNQPKIDVGVGIVKLKSKYIYFVEILFQRKTFKCVLKPVKSELGSNLDNTMERDMSTH